MLDLTSQTYEKYFPATYGSTKSFEEGSFCDKPACYLVFKKAVIRKTIQILPKFVSNFFYWDRS